MGRRPANIATLMTPNTARRLAFLAAACVVLAGCSPNPAARAPVPAAAAPAPANATPAPAAAAELVCRANYDYCIEVNGAYPPDARFFKAETRGRYLVDIPSQSKSLLLDMPARRAVSVPRASITPEATDGVVRVADPGPSASPAYPLAIDGSVLGIQADTSKVRVLNVIERTPLVGPVSFAALVADRPEYREGMKAYKPDPAAIETMKKSKAAIEIEAYFGTWCPHCKDYMPKFLRAIQDAANPNIKLTLVGLPKGFGNVDGPWKGKNIERIPAILLRYQGMDFTRLGSHEGVMPEVELAAILGAIK